MVGLVLHRQRRVAVPDLKRVEAEPLALELVVAVRQARVGGDDGVAQRLDHLGLDLVGQVPAGLRRRHLAPAVLDLLLLGERVVDAREELDVGAEDAGQFARGGLALGAVVVGEEVERGFEVQRLAVHGEFEAGDGLVEEAVPGGGADGGLVVEEPLELVRQLVRLHRAQAVEDRLVAGEVGVGGELRGKGRVVDPVDLEREEDERRGEGGDAVLRVGDELGALGVGGVLVVAEPRVGHQAARHGVDLLVARDAVEHAGRVERGQLALVVARRRRRRRSRASPCRARTRARRARSRGR